MSKNLRYFCLYVFWLTTLYEISFVDDALLVSDLSIQPHVGLPYVQQDLYMHLFLSRYLFWLVFWDFQASGSSYGQTGPAELQIPKNLNVHRSILQHIPSKTLMEI